MSQVPVIHWFRRDLRMRDNLALHAACEGDAPVIPLFIFDDALLASPRVGAARLSFMLHALHALDQRLQAYGTRLLVRRGHPVQVLRDLVAETGATALYVNRDYSPYARQRDAEVEAALAMPVHAYDDAVAIAPGAVLKDDGEPYVVYSPFRRAWNKLQKPAESVRHFRAEWFYDQSALSNHGIPDLHDLGYDQTIDVPPAGEDDALKRLTDFIDRDIHRYKETRNDLVIDPFSSDPPVGSSYLSPYFRLGMLSPRQAYWAARDAYERTDDQDARKSIEHFVSEVVWREFYTHILAHFPHVMQRDFVATYKTLPWRDDAEGLAAWKRGETGYPVVDAAMRQLQQIGWLPNRARMVVASFLTKDLLIHWLPGDIHFMQYLIDGDPASNNGGWQWAAGTGTDAQPYFRIFNPISQSKKFASPDYIRHYVPELRAVPDDKIHEPWTMKQPPKGYPAPIVDHHAARERTLEAFKRAKDEGSR